MSLLVVVSTLLAPSPPSQHPSHPAPVAVSGYDTATLHLIDGATGAVVAPFDPTAIPGAQSQHFGPDGNLYVCAEKIDQVLRFDGHTGAFLGVFVGDDPATPEDEDGGIDGPTGAVFGPDGNLYVGGFDSDDVHRYDGRTGQHLGTFVPPNSGNLNGPDAGICFGPDGNLFVPSFNNNRVLRFDGKTGAFLDAFVTPFEGTSRPRMLRFRGDGVLYVSSWGNNRINRYDLDGKLIDVFATPFRPTGFVVLQESGDLVVAEDQTNSVVRLDGATGAPKATLLPPGNAVIKGAVYVERFPDQELVLDRPRDNASGELLVHCRNASPGEPLFLLVGDAPQSQQAGPCAHAYVGVKDPRIVVLHPDAAGEAKTALKPPPFAGGKLVLQAFDLSTCRPSNLVILTR